MKDDWSTVKDTGAEASFTEYMSVFWWNDIESSFILSSIIIWYEWKRGIVYGIKW